MLRSKGLRKRGDVTTVAVAASGRNAARMYVVFEGHERKYLARLEHEKIPNAYFIVGITDPYEVEEDDPYWLPEFEPSPIIKAVARIDGIIREVKKLKPSK